MCQDVREEMTAEDTEALSFVRTLKAPSAKKKGPGDFLGCIISAFLQVDPNRLEIVR